MILHKQLSGELREEWDKAFKQSSLKVPSYTFSWQEIFWETLGKGKKPIIFSFPELSVLAPLIEDEGILQLSGGKEVSDYLDIIGPDKNKITAWTEIIRFAKEHNVRTLVLHNIPESSSTVPFFQSQKELYPAAVSIDIEDTTPKLTINGSFPDYVSLLPKKQRHELERKMRKFEREHDSVLFQTSQHLEEDINVLLQLMKLEEHKKTFLTEENTAFFWSFPTKLRNETVITKIIVNNEPAAVILGFSLDSTFFLYNTGFDQMRYPGSGFYLHVQTIQYAFEHGYREYNFLQGNERYKYDLGGKDFAVYTISLTTGDTYK